MVFHFISGDHFFSFLYAVAYCFSYRQDFQICDRDLSWRHTYRCHEGKLLHELCMETIIFRFQKKIPFPAFTVCATGNTTFAYKELISKSQINYVIPPFGIPTDQGQCRTINFCNQKKILRFGVNDAGIFELKGWLKRVLKNQTQPFMTTSYELGFDASILYKDYRKINESTLKLLTKSTFILMVHSPFELPTKANQKQYLTDMDYDTFFITPQLNTIDGTMIGMKPYE